MIVTYYQFIQWIYAASFMSFVTIFKSVEVNTREYAAEQI